MIQADFALVIVPGSRDVLAPGTGGVDERGDIFGGLAGELRQDAGVFVGVEGDLPLPASDFGVPPPGVTGAAPLPCRVRARYIAGLPEVDAAARRSAPAARLLRPPRANVRAVRLTRASTIPGRATAVPPAPPPATQFLPSTWQLYGDGGDISNPADAIPAAARLLLAHGAPGNLQEAIFAYNHSSQCVTDVLAWAARYAAGGAQAISAAGSALYQQAALGPLPAGTAGKVLAFAEAQLGGPPARER